jgi:Zn-dependent metalloprotease
MQRTYDYYLSAHGHQGYDGTNGYLPAYVRIGAIHGGAWFSSVQGYLEFADESAITALDIVAHEFTHAVYRSVNPGAVYEGESASVYESVADIFAVAVTFANGQGNWTMGEDAYPPAIRNLRNPKASSSSTTRDSGTSCTRVALIPTGT